MAMADEGGYRPDHTLRRDTTVLVIALGVEFIPTSITSGRFFTWPDRPTRNLKGIPPYQRCYPGRARRLLLKQEQEDWGKAETSSLPKMGYGDAVVITIHQPI